ncbi:MAG: TonB-dependent receptor [Gammaproteobacteria bacterium]
MTAPLNTTQKLLGVSVASFVALALAQSPARAAEEPSADSLEEVVVTADKRGETSTQSVPIAIQAISGATLEKTGAVEFADYAATVPSLSYADLGPGDKKYVIRGITSTGPATVGVYYDEAVITASNANDGGGRQPDIRLFDLDRIEVLKGPQGTLYGASSMSGTIRYITRKPDLEKLGGYVEAEGSDTEKGNTNWGVNGALNLPIVEGKLALRVTGWDVDNSGYIDNPRIPAGAIKDINNDVTKGGRATLRWQALDNLNILATATYQTLKANGSSRYTPEGTLSFPPPSVGPIPGFPSIPGGDLVNTDLTRDPWDEKINIFGLTAEYTAPYGTITATSNYFKRDIAYAFDSSPILFFFGVPIPGITLQPQDRQIVSSELRYSSKLDGPVNFVVGAFSQNEKNHFEVNVLTIDAFGNAVGSFSRLDADDALQHADGNTFFGRTDNNTIDQYAAFGEVTYTITDKLSVLGGVRYFHSKQDSSQETLHPFGGFGPNIPVGVQTNSATASKTTFKANVSYKLTDDSLLYATFSEGFRIGGTNAADLPFASGIPPAYDPDSLKNYEIGAKSEFLDHKLRLNAAVYRIDWSDIQVQAIDTTGAFPFTTNAGTAQVNGFEIEANAILAPGLQLDFGGSYTDATLTADQPLIPNNPNLGKDGDRLPKVPKVQLAAALTYTMPVMGDAELAFRADVSHRGSSNTQFNSSAANTFPLGFNVPLDSYELVNLRATYTKDQWVASLFAKNVFDERAQVDAIASDQDPLARITVRPRTIGVSIKRTF